MRRPKFKALASAIAALALGAILAAPSLADERDVTYDRDRGFEREVASRLAICLPAANQQPEPASRQRIRGWAEASGDYAYYGLRLVYNMMSECLVENLTPQTLIKYGSLYAAYLLSPALAGAYAEGELMTDGVKCVAKAFIENADGPDRLQKNLLKDAIDKAASVKDVYSWVGAGYSATQRITDPDRIKDLEALQKLFEILHADYERAQDFSGFAETAATAVRDGDRYLQYVAGDETVRRFLDAEDAHKACRYDLAATLAKQSRAAAEADCRAIGALYRAGERDLRAYIGTNYGSLLAARPFVANPQRDIRDRKLTALDNLKRRMRRTLDAHEKAGRLAEAAGTDSRAFTSLIDRYRQQLTRARGALGGAAACGEIDRLAAIAAPYTPACRDELLNGGGRRLASAADLFRDLNDLARQKSKDWHDRLDAARRDTDACRIEGAREALRGLVADIGERPLLLAEGGRCREVEQGPLMAEIGALSDRIDAYAAGGTATVPDLEGTPLGEARKALIGRRLVVGEVTLGSPAPRDRKPGSVETTSIGKGETARICTEVALTVYGPHLAVLQSAETDSPPPGPAPPQVGGDCGPKTPDSVRRAMWKELREAYSEGRWMEKYKWNDVRTSDTYKGLRDEIINANYFPIHFDINLPIWRARLACFDGCIMGTPKDLQVNQAASRAYRACLAGCGAIKYNVCDTKGRITKPAPPPPPGTIPSASTSARPPVPPAGTRIIR